MRINSVDARLICDIHVVFVRALFAVLKAE